MTDKRLLKVLSGEQVWPPPIWLMRQAGRYLPEYRQVRAQARDFLDLCYSPDLATEVTLQPIRRYGFDAAILFADILLLPHALGQKLEFREGEGPVLEPVQSLNDLDRLGQRDIHAQLAPVYETVSRLRQALPTNVTLIGFAGAPWTVATYMVEGRGGTDHERVKNWAYGDPDGFERLLARVTATTIEYLSRQIEAGAEVVQLFDSWAGSLAADQFRRWVVGPIAQITAALRERYPSVPIIAFPRQAGANLVGFAEATGVQGISLDSAVPLEWAAANLASNVALQGNLDPRLLVVGGRALQTGITAICETLGRRPFIFNLGHGIVPQTPPDHVAQLISTVRSLPAP